MRSYLELRPALAFKRCVELRHGNINVMHSLIPMHTRVEFGSIHRAGTSKIIVCVCIYMTYEGPSLDNQNNRKLRVFHRKWKETTPLLYLF